MFIGIIVVLIRQKINYVRIKGTHQMKDAVSIKTSLRRMVSINMLMSVFGFTWLFAILTFSVTGLRHTFQILFTVFNSFQGFFAFLSFCVLDTEGFESFKNFLTCGVYTKLLKSSQAKHSSSAVALTPKQTNTGNTDLSSSFGSRCAPGPVTFKSDYKSATLTYGKESSLKTKADNGKNITVHTSECEQTDEHAKIAVQFDEEGTVPINDAFYQFESVSTFKISENEGKGMENSNSGSQERSGEDDATTQL